ncbi:hypothetical protein L9F63_002163, partial [Diploptera punctata]
NEPPFWYLSEFFVRHITELNESREGIKCVIRMPTWNMPNDMPKRASPKMNV